jgi:transcriptional regulator with XRE-family HTH domain
MPNGRPDTHNNAREPHQIDVIAGRNLRIARMRVGMSQQQLGDAVGITFQQVQKYERGTNRMAVSRAWDFATVLKISMGELLNGDHGLPPSASLDMPHFGAWLSLYRRATDAGVVGDFIRIAGSIVRLCESA